MTKQVEAKSAAPRKKPPREAAPKREVLTTLEPAADPAPAEESAETDAKETPPSRFGDDFFKIIERIPVVGPSLVYIIKQWGVPGLLLFTAGAALVVGLVASGVLPAALVSAKYKQAATPAPITGDEPSRTALKSINLEDVPEEGRPDWINVYTNAFERGSAIKRKDGSAPGLRYGVAVFKHEIEREPTRKFTLHLQPAVADYEITARVIRQTKGFFQPVPTTSQSDSLYFAVPACDVGDSLIVIVRAEWTSQIQFRGIRWTFTPSVISEGL